MQIDEQIRAKSTELSKVSSFVDEAMMRLASRIGVCTVTVENETFLARLFLIVSKKHQNNDQCVWITDRLMDNG